MILIADDDNFSRRRLQKFLEDADYEVITCKDGMEAWEVIRSEDAPNLLIIDWMMPGMDGLELCQKVRKMGGEPYKYILMLTSKEDQNDIVKGMEAGADDYITKPFKPHELRVRLRAGRRIIETNEALIEARNRLQMQADIEQNMKKLRKALRGTIVALSRTVEKRDPYTFGHQQRVGDLARAIASEIGLSEDIIGGLRLAGIIHDLGKIHVPAEILCKPGKLTKDEFNIVKTHPQVGYDILKDIEFPWPIAKMVLQHHEYVNGSGYPQGISGDEILIEAKILCVADVVESVSSHRPYRPSLGIEKALEIISESRGILFDSDVVDACLILFQEKEFQLKEEALV
jgi:response regulator RpfG family c-di-GMP phosphodiesterase